MEKTIIPLALLVFVPAAFAERQPFDRYQSVVDRQMFGALPPGFDPTKMPSEVSKAEQKQLTKEQEQIRSAIHFSVINVTPEGATVVGFTDNSDPKAPVHYYLKVGEKRNGWEVKTADAAEASMTIAKGDIEVSLKIGGNSAKDAGATTKSGGVPPTAAAASVRSTGLLGGPLGARRRLRAQMAEAEKAKADEAAAAREAERQAQAEAEKAQREAERAEQRQQLQAIQEELKRVREAKATSESADKQGPAAENDQNDAN